MEWVFSPFGEKVTFIGQYVDRNQVQEVIENVFKDTNNIKIIGYDFNISKDEDLDLVVRLKIGDHFKDLAILISSSGEPRIIKMKVDDLIKAGSRVGGYPVYMAPFVSENGCKLIIEKGVGVIDLSGNVFLSFDNVLIDRSGFRNRFKEKRISRKIFSKKSTRIIRKLLSRTDKAWKITELAKEARVSSGFTSTIVRNLETEGFIEKDWGSIRLVQPGELLNRWADEYRFDKQISIGYYCPLEDREVIFKRLREIPGSKYALTMGAAASMIAPHVRSTDVYLYSVDNSLLIERLGLTPVEFGGNLYLTSPADIGVFFDKRSIDDISIVSNIQLYLDLFHYPARGREQAEFLRDSVMEI